MVKRIFAKLSEWVKWAWQAAKTKVATPTKKEKRMAYSTIA